MGKNKIQRLRLTLFDRFHRLLGLVWSSTQRYSHMDKLSLGDTKILLDM